MHNSRIDKLKPYAGGWRDYAKQCIHGGTRTDCKTCNRVLVQSDPERSLAKPDTTYHTHTMEKIDELEALILRLQQAYAATRARSARDYMFRKAHEFHEEQQRLIAESIAA